jgi:hypothetical protein
MTLAEVIPAARRLTAIEKLKLIRVLVEDLDIAEDIAPIEPFKTYDLPTPYDMFGAGAVLMEALKQSDTTDNLCASSIPPLAPAKTNLTASQEFHCS